MERILAADRSSLLERWSAARFGGGRVTYPLGYLASLDGARGLLTLGILLAHTRMALFEGAMVYMDVFFTMSGYLITSLLIKDYEKRGRISLLKFYKRRMMRLYPAFTAMIACLLALSWLFSSHFRDRLNEALVAWFYLMDYGWLFAILPQYTSHTWSLAVEEQFYLLWPLLFIGLLAISGLTIRSAIVIFGAAAAFWAWKITLVYQGAPVIHLYTAFDCRADALLFGCGLAVLLKAVDISSCPRLLKLCSLSLPFIALAMIAVGFTMEREMRWYYCISPLIGPLPAVISIVGLLYPRRTFMHALYEHPVPVFIGRICYGCYIWHFPIFVWVGSQAPDFRYAATFLVGWPATFAIAALSHYLIERPFMSARPGL